ncbi:MAG: PDZ domain-containing protein [Candidatus Omnitrophica bacterium]|nr:PDZ domain-containing protein [Candidatus Omnitrophota bacterium]
MIKFQNRRTGFPMKKELIISICAGIFLVMILIALFTNNSVQDATQDTFHEIKTSDMFKQAAYCPIPGSRQGYSNGGSLQQVVMPNAPPIAQGQDAPVLIKIMGVEAIQVGGGKVKITGVMGNSWADKAGLKEGDVLLSFNAQDITSLKQFQGLLAKAPPEKDAKIVYMRGLRKKKGIIFIGEGEMEGFLPIKP